MSLTRSTAASSKRKWTWCCRWAILTDDGTDAALDMRAAHNQALAAAGIPFYPLRGNHEPSLQAAIHFGKAFPSLPGTPGNGGSSPALPGAAGHTYSFVHKGVKFVLLDQFTLADGSPKGKAYTVADYQPWIDRELSAKDHRHAFVLAHKDLLGQTPQGQPVWGGQRRQPRMQNAFFASLSRNGVRYYLCGHDHMHYRSLVTSPDGRSTVQQIIGASDSYKFYTPKKPFSPRDRPLAQELYKIGYYIYTVDGPRLTARYYATPPFGDTPANPRWQLRETFGYSLNGREFLVQNGDSYARIADSVRAGDGFVGTTMRIRSGTNHTPETTRSGRLAKLVTTGWSPKTGANLASDVLTLWGMAGRLGSDETDTFVLSMSFHRQDLGDDLLKSGAVGILARDADGKWRLGRRCQPGRQEGLRARPLGQELRAGRLRHRPDDNTAWAVVNHASDFAVGKKSSSRKPRAGHSLQMSAMPGRGLTQTTSSSRRPCDSRPERSAAVRWLSLSSRSHLKVSDTNPWSDCRSSCRRNKPPPSRALRWHSSIARTNSPYRVPPALLWRTQGGSAVPSRQSEHREGLRC